MEKRILLADDSLTIQKVVELTFADSDIRLTAVSNGRLALEHIAKEPPDLILADVVMPEKNGYELCEEVKRNPATAHIPVVLLAGTFEPFDRARAGRLECDAIVSKPFDSRELFRKVEALLAQPRPAKTTVTPGEPAAERGVPVGRRTLDEIRAPRFAAPPPSAFDAGFVDEDFTGSIKTFPSTRGEPLGSLYGPEDVHSALEAFRAVEPAQSETQPVHSPRADAPVASDAPPPIPPPQPPSAAASPLFTDEGRTQRIDVSDFRPPRAPSAGPAEEPAPPRRDTREPAAPPWTAEPLPLPAPAEDAAAVERPSAARELTDSEIDRIADRVARKVIEQLSDRVVRDVAWEVVPETAEMVVRERIRELESGVE